MVWCGCHEILIQRSFNVLFLTRFCHFRWTSSSFSFAATISHMEEFFHKMPISLENWNESAFFQWLSRQFSPSAQALFCLVYSSLHLCLFVSPRHNSRRHYLFMRVLSHLDTLELDRHMIGPGATKSWFSAVSLFCSCRLFSAFDPTMILVVELLEPFILAC